MNYIKRFKEWIKVKEKIEDQSGRKLDFSEREVWMCYWGENVGYESCGKNELFHRPVIVLHKFGRNTFYGIPLSTKIKESNRYYLEIEFNSIRQSALVSQMRVMDVRRLHYKKGKLSQKDYRLVKKSFMDIIKNNPSKF